MSIIIKNISVSYSDRKANFYKNTSIIFCKMNNITCTNDAHW